VVSFSAGLRLGALSLVLNRCTHPLSVSPVRFLNFISVFFITSIRLFLRKELSSNEVATSGTVKVTYLILLHDVFSINQGMMW
jgi:hypothetical protein